MTANPLPSVTDQIPAPSHHDGTDTEKITAALMTPRAGTLRERALIALHSAGDAGLTDHELSERTGVYLYSIAPRRSELVRLGWVEDSGQRRITPQKAHAVVWVLSYRARTQLAAS
jgi:hypothetical protein